MNLLRKGFFGKDYGRRALSQRMETIAMGRVLTMRPDFIPIFHHEELFFFKWVQTKEEGTGYGESIKKGEVKLGIRSENGLL